MSDEAISIAACEQQTHPRVKESMYLFIDLWDQLRVWQLAVEMSDIVRKQEKRIRELESAIERMENESEEHSSYA